MKRTFGLIAFMGLNQASHSSFVTSSYPKAWAQSSSCSLTHWRFSLSMARLKGSTSAILCQLEWATTHFRVFWVARAGEAPTTVRSKVHNSFWRSYSFCLPWLGSSSHWILSNVSCLCQPASSHTQHWVTTNSPDGTECWRVGLDLVLMNAVCWWETTVLWSAPECGVCAIRLQPTGATDWNVSV